MSPLVETAETSGANAGVKVSVVIPTLNAGVAFLDLLEGIRTQRASFDYELLVVDSGSTDGTVDFARSYGARVYGIHRSEFNHGATRNLAVSRSRGEYVALVVQDAIPMNGEWLSSLVENLECNDSVAGVYGRQIPHRHARPLTKALVGNLASADMERQERCISDRNEYEDMPPARRRRMSAFDNVSSCIRRSVWDEFPFEHTSFGEDMRWAKAVIEAGYKVVYEPRSAVYHSHERGGLYDLRRYYVDQRLVQELFGLTRVSSLRQFLVSVPRSAAYLQRLVFREEGATVATLLLMFPVVKYALLSQLGMYLGNRSNTLMKISPKAYERLHGYMSRGI